MPVILGHPSSYDTRLDAVESDTSFPTLTIGTAPNVTAFEADGTMHQQGAATTFRDELGDISQLRIQGAGISFDPAEGCVVFANNCDYQDYLTADLQLNHDWKNGSSVAPHLHWWQAQAGVPNWVVQHRWQKQGGDKTTAWTNIFRNTTQAFTYTSGTINQISTFAAITPPVGYGQVSDILQVRILRDRTNQYTFGVDPVSSTAISAVSFDLHVECDTLGSRTEYTK